MILEESSSRVTQQTVLLRGIVSNFLHVIRIERKLHQTTVTNEENWSLHLQKILKLAVVAILNQIYIYSLDFHCQLFP